MSGSFSSLNTALSALRYQQSALDIASTNIANASTDGYVRRRVAGETVGAAAAPAVWSRSNEIGSGVQSAGVQRLVDGLLDTRVRREHGRQTYLDTKADAMARVENGLAEPGDAGVAAALTDFRSALQDLVNSPGSEAARSQVLSAASVVADAFQIQARNVADEAGDQRARLLVDQKEVNDASTQLAAANKTIATAKANGTDVSTLLDSRDQLALRLAELTGATATERPDGGMDVMLGGQSLVSGGSAAVLNVAGVAVAGSSTGTVSFSVTQPDGTTGASFDLTAGEMGGTAELLNDTLPTYLAGLDAIVTAVRRRPEHRPATQRLRPERRPRASRSSPRRPARPGRHRSRSRSPTRAEVAASAACPAASSTASQRRPAGRRDHRSTAPTSGWSTASAASVASVQRLADEPASDVAPRSTRRASSSPASASTRR